MRELNKNEVLTVGGGRGGGGGDNSGNHGAWNQPSRNSNSSKDQGEILGSNVACTLLGLAVTGITKSTFIGSCAGVACGVAAGNIDHTERQGPNHNGGAYHGHAGGMDGSNSGFGR